MANRVLDTVGVHTFYYDAWITVLETNHQRTLAMYNNTEHKNLGKMIYCKAVVINVYKYHLYHLYWKNVL